jgi:hypothetical protein
MAKRYLTLDIGASAVKLAEFEGGKGGLTLVNYGIAALAAPLDAGNAGALLSPALLDIVREKGIKPGPVAISISGQMVFPRFASIAAAGGAEKFDQMIRFEIEQNIPFPIDEMICDRQVLGENESGETNVMIVAAKTDQIEEITVIEPVLEKHYAGFSKLVGVSITAGCTVLIRLAHEMENYDTENWYPWQYKGGEKDYIHMWRHVVAIGREVAPHVRWIWSPNRMTPQSIRWYPGDEYVDYISITLNHKANRVPSYPIFEDYFRQEGVEKHFNRINKKIILSEVGYANQDETRRGEYLQSIFDWVEQDDRICGVVFFNHNKMEESQYRFSDSG